MTVRALNIGATLAILMTAVGIAACGGGDNGASTAIVRTAATSIATAPATVPPATTPPPAATTALTPASGGGEIAAIAVTEKDFAITLDKQTAAAGPVAFNVRNDGPSQHEFVIFKTDLAPDQLPVDPDTYAVSEDAAGLTRIDEAEEIAPGSSTTLSATLTPGRYVLICNLPAHYQQGMRAGFSVQ